MVQVSVLDLIPVRQGQSTGHAVAASVSLAKVADRAGCTRYWVAEHHNTPAIASTNPPVLIGMLASQTSQLIVGSGGVMLPNHAPLVIAEQFALLEAAFPGRIDLGIGRAPGTDPVTSWALRGGTDDQTLVEFPNWVEQVIAMLGPTGVQADIGTRRVAIHSTPAPTSVPAVWLLGSSDYSARLAARLGLPYVFAHHFTGEGTDQALALYRHEYRGEGRPTTFITVNVVVGREPGEAERLARPHLYSIANLRLGRPLEPLMSVEEAETAVPPVSEESLAALASPWLIGEAHEVAEAIFALADRFTVDEVMIQPVAGNYRDDPQSINRAREYAVKELATRLVDSR
ncbi:LLM class flavin-dependent oxidoreductase [Brooklawnia cerclae]|uniref:Luciferase family oxidoreductase group 1 n=1 Tax=Brooklawnia cerclae TaxID=349934 RepID=A0ABX0SK45_9ACTN|nr:LLM class flavin-dependent oxidoreductase [Brooklawnia cerclae]NIH58738.1 luciferase family oxidoreductase group 1 [Brooklawnia cerclae]